MQVVVVGHIPQGIGASVGCVLMLLRPGEGFRVLAGVPLHPDEVVNLCPHVIEHNGRLATGKQGSAFLRRPLLEVYEITVPLRALPRLLGGSQE